MKYRNFISRYGKLGTRSQVKGLIRMMERPCELVGWLNFLSVGRMSDEYMSRLPRVYSIGDVSLVLRDLVEDYRWVGLGMGDRVGKVEDGEVLEGALNSIKWVYSQGSVHGVALVRWDEGGVSRHNLSELIC